MKLSYALRLFIENPDLVQELSERRRAIVSLKLKGNTYYEIGQKIGRSHERIRQIIVRCGKIIEKRLVETGRIKDHLMNL